MDTLLAFRQIIKSSLLHFDSNGEGIIDIEL